MPAGRINIFLFYTVSACFLALNFYLVVVHDSLWFAALPVALAFALAAIARIDYLLLSLAFFTPLSLPLKEIIPGLSFDMNLPTEPLLFGLLLFFMLKLSQRQIPDRNLLRHPVTLAVAFYLAWMLFTSLTSSMPSVSLKYWISKLWFVVAFYWFGYALLQHKMSIYRFVLLYGIGFLPVIGYAWWRHSGYGFFDHQAANYVMNPFFKDHTSYGAMLVFFIPALFAMWRNQQLTRLVRMLSLFLLSVFSVALVFSYTRAAWLSLVVAIGVSGILWLKIRFRTVLVLGLVFVGIVFLFQDQLVERLETNKQESSAELEGHLNSISNVSTDASNVERLNRWSSAIAMFREKPLLGWGPGTYMFEYAPFQRTDLRTIISTNSADGGNAHSEYLGPLAESGILGLGSFLLLVVLILRTGFRVYAQAENKTDRAMALAVFLGLVSYLVHGFLNNFLDTDKAAVPFWMFTVFLVVQDLRFKQRKLS
ncbi:O-antigen ligase family protein [Mangrovibacterium sp.]|uniref:O-antigen ligase family protein n=1 Tax=Mangrovibacterium sp. TaxID=1961364 RepID=UPI00356A3227